MRPMTRPRVLSSSSPAPCAPPVVPSHSTAADTSSGQNASPAAFPFFLPACVLLLFPSPPLFSLALSVPARLPQHPPAFQSARLPSSVPTPHSTHPPSHQPVCPPRLPPTTPPNLNHPIVPSPTAPCRCPAQTRSGMNREGGRVKAGADQRMRPASSSRRRLVAGALYLLSESAIRDARARRAPLSVSPPTSNANRKGVLAFKPLRHTAAPNCPTRVSSTARP